MYTIRHGTRIRIDTPAKLNLFLELRRRRSDDYHELETLMVPISLYDTLIVQPRDDDRLNLQCSWAPGLDPAFFGTLPGPGDNLAHRALDRLRRHAGLGAGADVWLRKRIPAEAGLGGASADAAAALAAGNAIWRLGLSRQELSRIAAELGSDVPFFLVGSAAICRGRGELVEPLSFGCGLWLVLIKPPAGLSTAEVYRHAEVPYRPLRSDDLRLALESANLTGVGQRLFNRLQSAAASLSPWIQRMASTLEACGVLGHQMSGSGTSYFGLCWHRRHARLVAARLRAARLGNVLAVSNLGPGPA